MLITPYKLGSHAQITANICFSAIYLMCILEISGFKLLFQTSVVMFFIFVFNGKRMNACSYFCCSNIAVIVDVSFASTVCPIQYTVDLTNVPLKFVMSVTHYLCETLPHISALNHHIHQINFFM